MRFDFRLRRRGGVRLAFASRGRDGNKWTLNAMLYEIEKEIGSFAMLLSLWRRVLVWPERIVSRAQQRRRRASGRKSTVMEEER